MNRITCLKPVEGRTTQNSILNYRPTLILGFSLGCLPLAPQAVELLPHGGVDVNVVSDILAARELVTKGHRLLPFASVGDNSTCKAVRSNAMLLAATSTTAPMGSTGVYPADKDAIAKTTPVSCVCNGSYSVDDRVVAAINNPAGASGIDQGRLGTVMCGTTQGNGVFELLISWDDWQRGHNGRDYCDCPSDSLGDNSGWYVSCSDVIKGTPPTVTTNAPTHITNTNVILNGEVNGNGLDTKATFDFGATSNYGISIDAKPYNIMAGTGNTTVIASGKNLTCNTSYHYRARAVSSHGTALGADKDFITEPCKPDAVTNPASNLTVNSATLNGAVTPRGAATTVNFEYGVTTNYGSVVTATPATVDATATSTDVSAALSNLNLCTTYHYRTVAENRIGITRGLDQSFRTISCPPEVITEQPSDVTNSSAALNARVNDGGFVTTVTFDFGPSIDYGTILAATPSTINAMQGSTPVTANSLGLTADTVYHYRVRAANIAGTTLGADRPFSTNSREFFPPNGQWPLNWTTPSASNAPWYVADDSKNTGTYSLRSGIVSNNQISQVQVTSLFRTGVVRFALRLSSELSYDRLRFIIDGVEQARWVGDHDWDWTPSYTPSYNPSYTITAGSHTLLWSYEKDDTVNSGGDAAWIDDVSLPLDVSYVVTPVFDSAVTPSPNTSQSVVHGNVVSFGIITKSCHSRNDVVMGTCPKGSWHDDTWTTGIVTSDCTVNFSSKCQAACLPNMSGWRSALPTLQQFALTRPARNMVVYKITPSAGSGGSISPSSMSLALADTKAKFIVTADLNHIATVSGTCGGALVGNLYTTNPIRKDCTVIATFTVNLPRAAINPATAQISEMWGHPTPQTQVAGATNQLASVISPPAEQPPYYNAGVVAPVEVDENMATGTTLAVFTKLDMTGQELPDTALDYACLRDNSTGLVWEHKTQDGGLRDQGWSYTWYDSTNYTSAIGTPSGGICYTAGRCDIEKFVHDINAVGLCGAKDWRLPTVEELLSLTDVEYLRTHVLWGIPTTQSVTWAAFIADIIDTKSAPVVDLIAGSAGQEHFGIGNAVRLVRKP